MKRHLRTNAVHASFSVNSSPKMNETYTLHCHNFYEVYFFINGNIDYLVEGHKYKPTPYSLLLIAPNMFHGFQYKSKRPYHRYSFHFMGSLLPSDVRKTLLSPFHQENIYFTDLQNYQLDFFLNSLLDCQDLPEKILQETVNARTISLLSEIFLISQEQEDIQQKKKSEQFSIDNILSYINDNLDKKLTLDDICTQFYISKNHLNRLFKAATGTTVNSYINYKRLTLAKHYMLKEQTATEAAMNAGFGDYSNFYRTCRNLLGVSPSQLQNQNIVGAKEFWQ